MEEATKNESKASSDEAESAESAEQVADDAGTGRFYECMFCRRGFTTAQALGGHMNIHRKDRVRMRQTPAAAAAAPPARKFEDGCIGHGTHPHPQTYANHVPFFASVSEPMRSYSMYFPPTAAPSVGIRVRRPPPPPPPELSLFGEAEVSLSLGRRFDGGRLEEGEEKEKGVEELDLELRLGHHEP